MWPATSTAGRVRLPPRMVKSKSASTSSSDGPLRALGTGALLLEVTHQALVHALLDLGQESLDRGGLRGGIDGHDELQEGCWRAAAQGKRAKGAEHARSGEGRQLSPLRRTAGLKRLSRAWATSAIAGTDMNSPIQRRKDDHLDLCATDDVAFKGATTSARKGSARSPVAARLQRRRHRHQHDPARQDAAPAHRDRGHDRRHRARRRGEPRPGLHRRGARARASASAASAPCSASPTPPGPIRCASGRRTRSCSATWAWCRRASWPTKVIAEMVSDIGADALCVHLNPAQEIVQPEGDRDFSGGVETYAAPGERAARCPVVGKETGCGLSYQTALKLKSAGVRTVDTSGAGGTSWVGVETLRAQGDQARARQSAVGLGRAHRSERSRLRACGHETIATGGVQSGARRRARAGARSHGGRHRAAHAAGPRARRQGRGRARRSSSSSARFARSCCSVARAASPSCAVPRLIFSPLKRVDGARAVVLGERLEDCRRP